MSIDKKKGVCCSCQTWQDVVHHPCPRDEYVDGYDDLSDYPDAFDYIMGMHTDSSGGACEGVGMTPQAVG